MPPTKRPILPIVTRMSVNANEPLTTPECIALIIRIATRSSITSMPIIRIADELSILPMSSRTLTIIAVELIERAAARNMASYNDQPRALPTAKPKVNITRTSITAMPVPILPIARSCPRGKVRPTPKSKRTIAMSEKLFSIAVSLMRPNGPNGPIRMPATRNPRTIGCLRMYASAPTAEHTKSR